jgi:hypothetical protein
MGTGGAISTWSSSRSLRPRGTGGLLLRGGSRLPRPFLLSTIFHRFFHPDRRRMEMTGFEPVTSGVQNRRSPAELHPLGRCLLELFPSLFPPLSSIQVPLVGGQCMAATTKQFPILRPVILGVPILVIDRQGNQAGHGMDTAPPPLLTLVPRPPDRSPSDVLGNPPLNSASGNLACQPPSNVFPMLKLKLASR